MKYTYFQEVLGRIEVKHAIKTGIAASLSLILGIVFSQLIYHPSGLSTGIWSVLAAIVVMQAHLGGTYKAAWERFLGILIGSFMGGLFTTILGSNAYSLFISITVTVMVCSIFNLKDSIRIANLSVAIIIVMWGVRQDVSPWVFSSFRFLDSFLGILVAVIVAHSLWPAQATNKLRFNLAETILSLAQLYRLVTHPHTNDEKKEKTIDRLIRATDQLLLQDRLSLDESRLELLTKSASIEEWHLLIRYLDTIFEAIAALRHLRKTKLLEIVDQELLGEQEHLIETTITAFRQLATMLETHTIVHPSKDLRLAVNKLNDELTRFRTTRTTRKYDLTAVEGYFVFFYQLRSIVEDLIQIEAKIHALTEE